MTICLLNSEIQGKKNIYLFKSTQRNRTLATNSLILISLQPGVVITMILLYILKVDTIRLRR